MAGRSRDKLEKTKQALAEVGCKGQENIPVVLADSSDRSSLDAMAAQAKVVITTVGCDDGEGFHPLQHWHNQHARLIITPRSSSAVAASSPALASRVS